MRRSIQSTSRLIAALAVLAFLLGMPAAAAPLTIVALGDSLTAGLGLAAAESFPARLERALRARGHDVTVINAGVSGDTTRDGLARLDWSVGPEADAVIVELGANDALRGTDPAITRQALDAILAGLSARRLPVLVAGMRAPPNLGDEYAAAFNPVFPELAAKHEAILYPFFLEGIAGQPNFNLQDGIHPNGSGIDLIVEGMLPSVEALIARIDAAGGKPHTHLRPEGESPCRGSSPGSRSQSKSASDCPISAAAFPAPAGSTRTTTT
jgi:acyl-CoA thioesterase-1